MLGYMCFFQCSSSYNCLVLNYQVKKEEKNVKRTILKSVVGTLDLSVRHLLHGETFPGVCCRLLNAKCNLICHQTNQAICSSANEVKFLSQERIKAPFFCCINKTDPNRYGYVANLCVAKSARRQGIASSMLHLALESAKSNGKINYASVVKEMVEFLQIVEGSK